MAPLVAAKQTVKEIAIAILTAIAACINRCCRGKQQSLDRAKMGQVVFDLEDRLRKVAIELMRVNGVSPSRIEELKAEKNKLLAEIDAVTRAAGLRSRILSSGFE